MAHIKRTLSLSGHQTSLALEPGFWSALEEVAAARNMGWPDLVAEIDAAPRDGNLASAVRVHILNHFRETARQVDEKPTEI